MNQLYIQDTKRTPEILFETNGNLSIKGRSIPEDAGKFFEPLCKWLCEYGLEPQKLTTLNVSLEYFNSGSAKSLLQVLKLVTNLRVNGNEVVINWSYENGDDDILERGQYYASILNIEFNFFEI